MLKPDTLKKCQLLVKQQGLTVSAEKLGISREALARFMAGTPVRNGTRALIELRAADAFATLEAGGGK
jgi:hypothetical protein